MIGQIEWIGPMQYSFNKGIQILKSVQIKGQDWLDKWNEYDQCNYQNIKPVQIKCQEKQWYMYQTQKERKKTFQQVKKSPQKLDLAFAANPK